MKYNGIIQNAKALTYAQMHAARLDAYENHKYIMCVSPDNRLTLISPKPITSDLFNLAWEYFEYVNNNDGSSITAVYVDTYNHAGDFTSRSQIKGTMEPT